MSRDIAGPQILVCRNRELLGRLVIANAETRQRRSKIDREVSSPASLRYRAVLDRACNRYLLYDEQWPVSGSRLARYTIVGLYLTLRISVAWSRTHVSVAVGDSASLRPGLVAM